MTRFKNLLPLLCIAAACACSGAFDREKLLNENVEVGHDIAQVLRAYDQKHSAFPKSLEDMVTSGFVKALPMCKCADGKYRDFIYVPGLETGSTGEIAILMSPPEMDPEIAIVVFLNTMAKVLPREEAAKEIEKSRASAKR